MTPPIPKLVGGFKPSEKYEFVNWDDDIPIWENNPVMFQENHQPAILMVFPPLNPMKPPFSYGFPMVSTPPDPRKRLPHLVSINISLNDTSIDIYDTIYDTSHPKRIASP